MKGSHMSESVLRCSGHQKLLKSSRNPMPHIAPHRRAVFSMGGLAQLTTPLHRRLATKLLEWDNERLEADLPSNQPIHTLASGLWSAWKLFNDSGAWILVVVEETNQNQPDQRFVEFAVEELSQH